MSCATVVKKKKKKDCKKLVKWVNLWTPGRNLHLLLTAPQLAWLHGARSPTTRRQRQALPDCPAWLATLWRRLLVATASASSAARDDVDFDVPFVPAGLGGLAEASSLAGGPPG